MIKIVHFPVWSHHGILQLNQRILSTGSRYAFRQQNLDHLSNIEFAMLTMIYSIILAGPPGQTGVKGYRGDIGMPGKYC